MNKILLDVDGCVNALDPDNDPAGWVFEAAFRSSPESGGWRLNMSKEMGRALLELGTEIVWLTTWEEHANTDIGKHFGWAEKRTLTHHGKSKIFWKIEHIKDELAHPGDKVVWIDDDSKEFLQHFGSIEDADPHNRMLVICPFPTTGITKEHLDTIKKFLAD